MYFKVVKIKKIHSNFYVIPSLPPDSSYNYGLPCRGEKRGFKNSNYWIGLEVNDALRVIEFKNLIVMFETYDEVFTKNFLETLIETRQQKELENEDLAEIKRKEQALLYLAIERLKLNLVAIGSNPYICFKCNCWNKYTAPHP